MKPTHLAFMVLSCAVLTCSAQNVHHAIVAPDQPADLAHDGTYLWMPSGSELYQINTLTGDEEAQYSYPFHSLFGAAFDGTFIWVSDRSYGKIMKIDPLDGTIVDSYPVPAENPSGMAWDGSSLWLTSNDPSTMQDSLYEHDPATGQVLNSYDLWLDEPFGLAFDGSNLWSGENSAGEIHQLDPNNYISISSYTAPGGNYPNGLAFDGYYMWVSNAASDTIYKFDVGLNAIAEFHASEELHTFPNPSSGLVNIALPQQASSVEVQVIDLNGRAVRTQVFKQVQSVRLDLSLFEAGLYLIHINADGRVYRTRAMIAGN